MTQPDVALTDYALTIECSIFAYLLIPGRKSSPLAFWYIVFFLSLALASAFGGTVHGFYEEARSTGQQILWPLTMVSIGATAFSGATIGALLQFQRSAARAISGFAALVFLLYCILVLFVADAFVIAMIDYLPVALFLSLAFLLAYRSTKRPAFMFGFAGMCVTLAAAVVQQARLGLHPRYFNHNAVYHVLQGIGLFMLFITARDSTALKRGLVNS